MSDELVLWTWCEHDRLGPHEWQEWKGGKFGWLRYECRGREVRLRRPTEADMDRWYAESPYDADADRYYFAAPEGVLVEVTDG